MIPAALTALRWLKRVPWQAYALLAVLLAGWWYLRSYGKAQYEAGTAHVQALWDADRAAVAKAAQDAADAARARENTARARNEVIEREYMGKVATAESERDRYYGLLRTARGEVRAVTAREATSAVIAATAGEAGIADRIDRAVAGVIVEHRANADQLDALIAVVKGQME